jgi:lipooligosaccharide transport system permease protein
VTDYALTGRVAPWFTFGADRSLRLVYRNLRAARRYWLVMVSGFFEPLFYLVGLGVGVGALVGNITYGGETISYQEFVAPALLAASAMNGAIYETTGNVFFKLNYAKTYDGVLATPMGVRDVAVGETIFALMRGSVYAVAFVSIMLVLGLIESWWALLAVPAALLIGAAFAALGLSAVTLMRSWADFAFIELLTLPMFLFSATFVPLDEYPQAVQWVLPITPLYHGVDLMRQLTLGNVGWSALIHVGYLLGVLALGVWFTARRLEHKLLK